LSFWEGFAAILLVGSAVAVVRLGNAVHAALALIANFLVLAGVYLSQEARFVAMTQIIVYAGAIVVLFLFVIMLLSAAKADVGKDLFPYAEVPAIIGASALAGILMFALSGFKAPALKGELVGGLPQALGVVLYNPDKWLYAVLLIGFLLLAATVAAVVLVEPERIVPDSALRVGAAQSPDEPKLEDGARPKEVVRR
jgi:NADH-quinone oxidoreductase subunit J